MIKLEDNIDYGANNLNFYNISKDCVYFMYNSNDSCIYIGKSYKNKVNARMRAHRNKSVFFREVAYIKVVLFNSQIDTLVYELYQINKIKPTYNKDIPEGVSTMLDVIEIPQQMYYRSGDLIRKYKTIKPRVEQGNPSDRLLKRKEAFEGKVFNNLRILKVFKEGYYKGEFLCSCGKVGVRKLSHITNGRAKSCGCLHKIINTSPYYKEYKDIQEITKVSIETIKYWRDKYKNIRKAFKRSDSDRCLIGFKTYFMELFSNKEIELDGSNIGNYKGSFKFNLKSMKYEKC